MGPGTWIARIKLPQALNFGSLVKRLPPPGLLGLMYLTFIVLGTMLLKLPFSTTQPVSWSDAFFTSTSAVTVTGLVVVDPGTAFTFFGQAVIAFLIQMGGLGLMTFAVLILLALGIPVGIPQRLVLREDLNQTSMGNLLTLVRVVVGVALAVEVLGAALLALIFVPDYGLVQGSWLSLFFSISAFNNAGFALFPDSLMSYTDTGIINFVTAGMFITSGLGFVVLADIADKRRWRPLALHTKLMLSGSAVLIVLGCVGFGLLEWTNPDTLGGLEDIRAKLMASFFQGVTPRTAGFNTVDTTAIRDSTALMTIGLMLVGGGSASTAGGIKVTTAIVLVLATIAFFKRSTQLNAFGRSLGPQEVFKVMALTAVSIVLVFTGLFVLVIMNDDNFLLLFFEVASAFGTVGLSMGATSELGEVGRGVICLIMFLGRVGPLALGFFLATQGTPRVRYPRGTVYLG